MKIERLKRILNNLPTFVNGIPVNELELFVRNSDTPFGEMANLEQIESGFDPSGDGIPCLILNTSYTSEKLEDFSGYSTVDYKEDSKRYNQNLAIQKKIVEFLSARVDEATIFRYLNKQIPGTLSDIDYYFITKLLSELVGELVTRAEFEMNRDNYYEAIMAFDLEQVKKGK